MSRHHKFVERRRIHSQDPCQCIPQSNKWSRPVNSLAKFFLFIAITGYIFNLSGAMAIEPPFTLPQSSDLDRIKSAVITTSRGKMAFELFPEEAPWHVANFKYLADTGFYRGKTFHILIADFIIQGGRNDNQEMHYVLPAEFGSRKHEFGVLGMARAADYMNPQRSSSSTQFHILLSNASNMNGSYTIFGKLIDGSDVLESLRMNDRINDVTVFMEDSVAGQEISREPPRRELARQQPSFIREEYLDQWAIPERPDAHVASYDTSLTYGRLP